MKQILITGASTGIGYSLANTLLEQGHIVYGGVRNVKSLERLKENFPDRLIVLKLDVTSEDDIRAAFAAVEKGLGASAHESSPEDKHLRDASEFVLVNNAGIAVAGPIEGLELKEWRELFEVNFFGAVRLTQIFLPLLRTTHGRVINVGSISGLISSPFLASYCSSKFALRSFSDSLRRELMPHNVRVVLIEPGPVRTEIWSKSIQHSEESSKRMSPEMKQVYGKQIEGLRSSVKESVRDAIPVEVVSQAMAHAVLSSSPKLYYLLGRRIRLHAAIGKFLPARLLDKMMMSGLGVERN
jgi:Short-chain dehydrogenases of various substrate specificities